MAQTIEDLRGAFAASRDILEAGVWDERKHPRSHGKFASKAGGAVRALRSGMRKKGGGENLGGDFGRGAGFGIGSNAGQRIGMRPGQELMKRGRVGAGLAAMTVGGVAGGVYGAIKGSRAGRTVGDAAGRKAGIGEAKTKKGRRLATFAGYMAGGMAHGAAPGVARGVQGAARSFAKKGKRAATAGAYKRRAAGNLQHLRGMARGPLRPHRGSSLEAKVGRKMNVLKLRDLQRQYGYKKPRWGA